MSTEDAVPYLDPRLSPNARAADLVARMTLREKAGQLFHTMALFSDDRPLTEPLDFVGKPSPADMILDRHMTHFNMLGVGSGEAMARWHNRLQDLSLETRLQIPITLSSDPRHGFSTNLGTALATEAFSSWPEPLGLAALGDEDLVQRYGDICRREFLAIGVRVALHPQLDTATEPRWSRTAGTFGDDPALVARLGLSYIRGLQGGHVGPDSLATMVKHFPGNGPVENGEDPHFEHGQRQLYPGGNFEGHLAPFRAAVTAGVSQIMPSYGVPIGTKYDEVGCGFNRSIITDLLRTELGFEGIVCTDWGLINDGSFFGEVMPARAWGVEDLGPVERLRVALDAGVDQFGGEHCPDLIVELVESGTVEESRIDRSVRSLLQEKFTLGLFERRHVDVDAAAELVGNAEFRAEGRAAQSRSVTVLTNHPDEHGVSTLPLRSGCRIYLIDLDPAVALNYGEVATKQADADVTIIRARSPHEQRPGAFESMFPSGSLDFDTDKLTELLDVLKSGPTVLDITLSRPAILTLLADHAAALVVNYGCSDEALLDALFGRVAPTGRLPVALPRSTSAIEASPTDLPLGGEQTLFARGAGLTIAN